MTSSPYTYVPTAATTLARRLQRVLNAARACHGLPRAPLIQVDRVSPSAGDYGTLSAQARDRRMAANTLSFRRFQPSQVRDAHLLIIDDVQVTGAHQRCLIRASEKLPLAARTFLYIASFGSPADGCFDRPRKTRSIMPPSVLSMTWPGSWKQAISPGTCECASSSSPRPLAAICLGFSPGCPAGSSRICIATAAWTAIRGWATTLPVTRRSARNWPSGGAGRSRPARPDSSPPSQDAGDALTAGFRGHVLRGTARCAARAAGRRRAGRVGGLHRRHEDAERPVVPVEIRDPGAMRM
jgi:hypothetical protein